MVPLNVPNVLTVIRILLVPVLVVALLEKTGGGDLLAAIVFATASATDAIDGRLARAQNSVTTFGKLMDPLADKLLVMAALITLVSLNRLEAWVAMVIIAREFAVTVLRVAVGAQEGIVISASNFGKLKTALPGRDGDVPDRGQPPPPGVGRRARLRDRRDHGASGVDYFFGISRVRARGGVRLTQGVASSQARRLVWTAERSPVSSSPRISPSVPNRSAITLCWWIVSRFSCLAETNTRVGEHRERVDDAADHLAHAVLDEARAAVRLLDDVRLVGALHQLVDLRRHRALDDRQQRGRVDLVVAQLGAADRAACQGRAGCGSRPGRWR